MRTQTFDLQATNGKHHEKGHPLDEWQVQSPNSLHGQRYDNQIEDEARQGLGMEETLDIKATTAWNGSIPLIIQ